MSARSSRSRASCASATRWRLRARRQAAEQTVCRPVSGTAQQTGQQEPTTGVRTLSGETWRVEDTDMGVGAQPALGSTGASVVGTRSAPRAQH